MTHGRTSKGPNACFGRTPVKSTIWSHDGQKDPFVIFGHGAPKMGKKSWRETIGIKVRSEILSPGQNLSSVLLKCDHGSHFQNYDLERLRTFTPMVPKVFLQDFYAFWASHCRKLQIGLFNQRAIKWCFGSACDKNLGSVLLKYDNESNFQNFDLERFRTFTPMVPRVSLQDFLSILGAPWLKITNRSF